MWLDPLLRFLQFSRGPLVHDYAEDRSVGMCRHSWVTRCLHSHSVSFLSVGRGADVPLCKKELKYVYTSDKPA